MAITPKFRGFPTGENPSKKIIAPPDTCQCPANFTGQCRPPIRSHMSPNLHTATPAGHLYQVPPLVWWVYPHPVRDKFHTILYPAALHLDDQSPSGHANVFAIGCVLGIHNQRHTQSQHFHQCKRQHQLCPQRPAPSSNTQRHTTQAQQHPAQLNGCHRTIAAQSPGHTIRVGACKPVLGWGLSHC